MDHSYFSTAPKKSRTRSGVVCWATNCSNRQSAAARQHGITLHRFPNKKTDALRRSLWEQNCRRAQKTTEYSSLCSAHFVQKCFDRTGQIVRLRPGAVPTLFDMRSQSQVKSRKACGTEADAGTVAPEGKEPALPTELLHDHPFVTAYTNVGNDGQQTSELDASRTAVEPDNLPDTIQDTARVKEVEQIETEHAYQLGHHDDVKRRMAFLVQSNEKLRKKAKNSLIREKRAKLKEKQASTRCRQLLRELTEKTSINTDLQLRLASYKDIRRDLFGQLTHREVS